MTDKQNGTKTAFLIIPNKSKSFVLLLKGRQAWMLEQLLEAGPAGFTSRDAPGARMSEYVSRLRFKGVVIVTLRQKHGGGFPGVHGVYLLQCQVRRIRTYKGGEGNDL
jgi:hypothetical protein